MTAHTTNSFVRLHLAPVLAEFGFARKGNRFIYLSEEKVWCWATVKPSSSAELVLFQFRMEVTPDASYPQHREALGHANPVPSEGWGARCLDLFRGEGMEMPFTLSPTHWSFFRDGRGLDECLGFFTTQFRRDGVPFFDHWSVQRAWEED